MKYQKEKYREIDEELKKEKRLNDKLSEYNINLLGQIRSRKASVEKTTEQLADSDEFKRLPEFVEGLQVEGWDNTMTAQEF